MIMADAKISCIAVSEHMLLIFILFNNRKDRILVVEICEAGFLWLICLHIFNLIFNWIICWNIHLFSFFWSAFSSNFWVHLTEDLFLKWFEIAVHWTNDFLLGSFKCWSCSTSRKILDLWRHVWCSLQFYLLCAKIQIMIFEKCELLIFSLIFTVKYWFLVLFQVNKRKWSAEILYRFIKMCWLEKNWFWLWFVIVFQLINEINVIIIFQISVRITIILPVWFQRRLAKFDCLWLTTKIFRIFNNCSLLCVNWASAIWLFDYFLESI